MIWDMFEGDFADNKICSSQWGAEQLCQVFADRASKDTHGMSKNYPKLYESWYLKAHDLLMLETVLQRMLRVGS